MKKEAIQGALIILVIGFILGIIGGVIWGATNYENKIDGRLKECKETLKMVINIDDAKIKAQKEVIDSLDEAIHKIRNEKNVMYNRFETNIEDLEDALYDCRKDVAIFRQANLSGVW